MKYGVAYPLENRIFTVDLKAFFSASLLLFLLAFATSASCATQQDMHYGNLPGIFLSAPKQVLELLKNNFELPTSPLPDDTARAAYMRQAQEEISALLATEGYFTPTMELHAAQLNGVQKLEIMPGPRTKITQLNIEFIGDIAADSNPEHKVRMEQLRAAWPLEIGKPFRSKAWEEAKASLLYSVSRKDYTNARITLSQATVDPASASAKLTVVIDSGPAFRFGKLEISGLERYDKNLVVRLAPFHTGDAYRQDLLLAYQARLQAMPQFSLVIININRDVSTHTAAPVEITLTEAKIRRVAIGIGYSTNNGTRNEINYLNHNFLNRAWNLNTGMRLEQNRQTSSAGVSTQPDDTGHVLSWGVSKEATQIAGLHTSQTKLSMGRSRTQGLIERREEINWQQESRQPAGGIHEINTAVVLDWQWRRPAVDNPLYPRNGNVTEFRIGGASRHLLSDHDFLRNYVRQQIWWPLGERDVFSLRGEIGVTVASSSLGIPQEYLFRAGGSQSVRGYSYQSLGIQEGGAVVGGRALATGSAEYTHWFSPDWGAALFADTGGVSNALNTLQLSTGYGSGARWRSPVGPLAFDLAWGRKRHALRLHFSLAAVF